MDGLRAAVIACSCLCFTVPSHAHAGRGPSEASVEASAASVATVVSGVGASAGMAVALPVALSAEVGTLVVKSIEMGAHGIVCVLERVSDGARATIEMAANGVGRGSLAVGTVVTSTATASGVVLSAAGQAIAFIPNQVGAALLHNERLD